MGPTAFLFTDLEHSTKLWEAGEEAMKSALACHDELLAAAITGHGGELFTRARAEGRSLTVGADA